MEDRYVEVSTSFPRPSHPLYPGASRWGELEGRQPHGREGVRVRYVMQGEGPAVLLVHGLGVSLAVWGENIAHLARGYTVYALDLPGHGRSDKPTGLSYDAVNGASFLVGFMDAAGISGATLIGNSAGGLVTAICAISHPQRVEGLVLVDAAGLGRQMAWFLRLASLPILGELLHAPNVRNTRNMIKSVFYEPRYVSQELVKELVAVRNTPDAKRTALNVIRSGIGLGDSEKI